MSKNVHPYVYRLGVLRDWKSRWFETGSGFKDLVRADTLIREFIQKELRDGYVSDVEIERSRQATRVIIRTSRPGMIIGRSGEGAQNLKNRLMKFMRKNDIVIPNDFKLDIADVENPDANASVVALGIREALEKRMPFRRILKQTVDKVAGVKGVKGVKITLAGRLGGAEMSRKEELKQGGIPLQFIRGDIDYAYEKAILPYGAISVKVWIYKGDSLAEDT